MQYFYQEASLDAAFCSGSSRLLCLGLTSTCCWLDGSSCAFIMTSVTGLVQYLLYALAGVTLIHSDILAFKHLIHPYTCLPLG